MTQEYQIGVFRGRKLIQRRGEVGGAKSVFVKLQGIKNELVYPTFGGFIQNPFKGAAKMFAGDLMYYETDEHGAKPKIWLLKTYKVVAVEGAVVYIENDGYKHIPFVGDSLGVAPEEIGGAMTAQVVTKVEKTTYGGAKVFAVTFEKSGLKRNSSPAPAPGKVTERIATRTTISFKFFNDGSVKLLD